MDISNLIFVAGAEQDDRRVAVAAQDRTMSLKTHPHTGAIYWSAEAGWTEIGIAPQITTAMSRNESGQGFMVIDPAGKWLEQDGDSTTRGQLLGRDGQPTGDQFRALGTSGDGLYAGGVGRQVFERIGRGAWRQINTAEMRRDMDPVACFEGISGFSPDEVYAVGWNGEIWSFVERHWDRVDSPTNLILNDVTAGTDRCVAVGLKGVIVEGRGNDWRTVDQDETTADFWSVAFFDGAFYLATQRSIYVLADGQLTRLNVPPELTSLYHLSSGPSGILSVGATDVALFDGNDWSMLGRSNAI